ncbi:double zinc ribbon domain-containing protein [Devosia sp. CAU 1758]
MALMETGSGEVKEIGLMAQLGRRLAGLGRVMLDELYPPGCPACNAPLVGHDGLCPDCFGDLRQISAPLCPVLGIPFETDMGPDMRSAEALADPPPFARARAAVGLWRGGRHAGFPAQIW